MQLYNFETSTFQRIFDKLQKIVNFRHIAVFMLEGTEVTLIAYRGPIPPDKLQFINFDLSNSVLLDTIYSTDAPLLIEDMDSDQAIAINAYNELNRYQDNPFDYVKTYMGFPLYSEDKIIAFIDFAHDQRFFYNKETLYLVQEYIERISNEIFIAMFTSIRAKIEITNFAVSEIDNSILTNLDLGEALNLILTKIYQLIPAQLVEFFLSEETMSVFMSEKEIPPNVYPLSLPCEMSPFLEYIVESGETFRVADIFKPPAGYDFRYQETKSLSFLLMPIKTSDEIFGVIAARDKVSGVYSPADERILEVLANRTGIAIKNALLYKRERESRRLSEELARMQEQQRIAMALHDSVAQLLFRLGLEVKICEKEAGTGSPDAERFQNIHRLIAQCDEELRSAIFALKNNDFYDESSQAAKLKSLVDALRQDSDIEMTLLIPKEITIIPNKLMEVLVRVIRESLTNIKKHSGAQGALVSLSQSGPNLVLIIQDNGKGFSESSWGHKDNQFHFGIETMNRLVTRAGGTFSIGENDECGVIVRAVFPFPGKESK